MKIWLQIRNRKLRQRGFSLVELLIVVGIVSILAAIAVPNFLSAQTRSRISRARGDLRTFATAIEAYAVDQNRYPASETFLAAQDLALLSTPVAYLQNAAQKDPFGTPRIDLPSGPGAENETRGYGYIAYNTSSRFYDFEPPACRLVPHRGWSVVSQGPNRKLDGAASLIFRTCPAAPQAFLEEVAGRIYDATNGTRSRGDLIRFGGDIPAKVLSGTL